MIVTTPSKLNEFNHAEDPVRRLLERLRWTYVSREALAVERPPDGNSARARRASSGEMQ